MTKLFSSFVVLLTGLLTVSMLAGCGGDDIVTDEPVPANFVSATPPGGEVAVNGTITVIFDNPPTDVTANAGNLTVAGKTATITGPFTPPGPLTLTITWANGIQTLNYTVTAPCCSFPDIIGGTIRDGDTDVDPELINSDGIIEVHFIEEVTGNIALQTEDGTDVGWLGRVEGDKAILELVKGRELVNETVYVITGKVTTNHDIKTNIKITFVTKAKA